MEIQDSIQIQVRQFLSRNGSDIGITFEKQFLLCFTYKLAVITALVRCQTQ